MEIAGGQYGDETVRGRLPNLIAERQGGPAKTFTPMFLVFAGQFPDDVAGEEDRATQTIIP